MPYQQFQLQGQNFLEIYTIKFGSVITKFRPKLKYAEIFFLICRDSVFCGCSVICLLTFFVPFCSVIVIRLRHSYNYGSMHLSSVFCEN